MRRRSGGGGGAGGGLRYSRRDVVATEPQQQQPQPHPVSSRRAGTTWHRSTHAARTTDAQSTHCSPRAGPGGGGGSGVC